MTEPFRNLAFGTGGAKKKKVLVKVDNANHGTSYLEDKDLYINELAKFFNVQ